MKMPIYADVIIYVRELCHVMIWSGLANIVIARLSFLSEHESLGFTGKLACLGKFLNFAAFECLRPRCKVALMLQFSLDS